MSDNDAIVLGAGISGLVSAHILSGGGQGRVVVVDEFAEVGGNHLDCAHGGYTFDVGSFIFQDDSPLLRHFPELLPLYVPIEPSWGKLTPQGNVAAYPIDLRHDLVASGPAEWARMAVSVLGARLFHRRIANAREFARYWIGARFLKQSGLENYMERFFGIPADALDVEIAEKRMLWIKEHANAAKMIRLFASRAPRPASNRQLARPREGYRALYAPAVRRLEADGVSFLMGTRPQRLRRDGDGFALDLAGRTIHARRVVSTIPIEHARALCGMTQAAGLETVTLISLFYSFRGDLGFDRSVLYNFSFEGAWKRLTLFSAFYGRVEGRDYFTVEVIASQVGHSVERADADFRRTVAKAAILAGDLSLEGSRTVPHAYPLYSRGAAARAADALAELKDFGVESFGRQGGFDYQPTARVSTLRAETELSGAERPAVAY